MYVHLLVYLFAHVLVHLPVDFPSADENALFRFHVSYPGKDAAVTNVVKGINTTLDKEGFMFEAVVRRVQEQLGL